ncbi:MAG TPA: 2-dehydropantoate 2-reductase [Methylomirabilota bacterium]|nr:2-dehydropantoate 2-reductase [Methylomirabilota bacterium]
MRIGVMGAGGVGGYFGGRLAQAGHQVTFVARGAHLAALREHGLTLRSPLGDTTLNVRATEDPAEAAPVDVVLFAVKLWDTESAAERIRPLVESGALVIPLQNGVESIERIGSVLGPARVMGGAAYIFARIVEPGVIVHTGRVARLRFGPVDPAQRPAAEAFLAACREAGVEAELADDIVRVLWEKFVLLVGVSGTTSLARSPIGVVRADPDLRWLLEASMREAWAVGRARGIALADHFVAQQLAFVDGLAPELKSSMAGDLEAGGRLEAPWLAGAVARMTQTAGIDAPVNRVIYAALKPFLDGTR